MVNATTARLLARCNGFAVAVDGEVVGVVATPVFAGTTLAPEYLLVRIGHEHRAVPPELVAAVDPESETVHLEVGAVEA